MNKTEKKPTCCAFVLARGGSSLKGKNIMPICGRPLIDYCLQSALSSNVFDNIVVSTDCPNIAEKVRSLSDKFEVFDRDASTATDTASSESGIVDFVSRYPKKFDIYCMIQATSPLVLPEHFKESLEKLLQEVKLEGQIIRYGSLLATTNRHTFLWKRNEKTGVITPVNYFPVDRPRRQDWKGLLCETGAFYWFRREEWEKVPCRLGGLMTDYEMPPHTLQELDHKYEVKVLEALLPGFAFKPPVYNDIKLMIFDFDGVLSDCKRYYSASGENMKRFDMKDGQGLSYVRDAGIKLAVITRSQPDKIILDRCKDLGIEIVRGGVYDKKSVLMEILQELDMDKTHVSYMGDDEPDLECLKMVGLSACPSDAHISVLNACRFVSKFKGGKGAVRELCDYVRKNCCVKKEEGVEKEDTLHSQ
jgi:YrbI family 3-deoxy-D-manno-octulosonate 8-phosphate phosphatase